MYYAQESSLESSLSHLPSTRKITNVRVLGLDFRLVYRGHFRYLKIRGKSNALVNAYHNLTRRFHLFHLQPACSCAPRSNMSAALITNVDKKLLRTTKFPPEFDRKVDMEKVNVPVIKKWVADEVARILNSDDDIVTELISNVLEETQFVSRPIPRRHQTRDAC